MLSCGLTTFTYRADQEPSIVALVQEACRSCGRIGEDVTPPGLEPHGDFEGAYFMDFNFTNYRSPDVPPAEPSPRNWKSEPASSPKPVIAGVPEHSNPGESHSNGADEAAMKPLISHARTLKAALER